MGGCLSTECLTDYSEHVVIVLTGGSAKIGVELARPEFRGRPAQGHVLLPGSFALPRHAHHLLLVTPDRHLSGAGRPGGSSDGDPQHLELAFRLALAELGGNRSRRCLLILSQVHSSALGVGPMGVPAPSETVAARFFPRRARWL